MTFKRNVDRLPIIPKDATVHNVTCNFCIVGCGYKAYSWDVSRQGGSAAGDNWAGVDLGQQQAAETDAWYPPSMYNIVRQNGRPVHLVIKPDKDCVVNSGLGSVRGARMAELNYSKITSTQLQRLTEPMVWRYGQMQPTSWDDALVAGGRDHRPGDQGAGRGRAVRLGLRPWRRRRRLREHLGHRQALFRCDEDQEHPHPQPPGLQQRGPRHPRHGRGRAQQLLRGRRARRHDRGRRHQRARDPDQLFPEPLGPEPARHLRRRRRKPSCRASRTRRRGS